MKPGSVAMHSGLLHVGDCIIAINGTCVDSMTTEAIFYYFLV
ncbi:PDZ domain-containing protein [Wolbachia pipientis]